jgi:hypothetical protein
MSRYSEFFLNSASSVVQLELIEISHPSFSKVYRVVRNAIDGVTVTLETGLVANFEYYPLNIKPTGVSDDLDQTLEIQLGDLGEIIPYELDNIAADGTFNIKPTLLYRTYRSDDLTQPLYGPFRYVISNMPFTKEGVVLNAGAPRVNQNTTGEIYTIDRFPTLQGFL